MTRTLGTRSTDLLARDVLVPVPLLKITTYLDKVNGTVSREFWLSDRPARYDYDGTVRQFVHALGGFDDLRESISHLAPSFTSDSAALGSEATVRIMDIPLGDETLFAQLERENLTFASVEFSEVYVATWEGEDRYDLSGLGSAVHRVLLAADVDSFQPEGDGFMSLRLTPRVPVIPWIYMNDPQKNDPKDLGKRLPMAYGDSVRIPLLGWNVGFVTTIAQGFDVSSTDEIVVSDGTGFPSTGNFTLRASSEEITVTRTGADDANNGLVVVTRGANGSTASAHIAGDVVFEQVTEAVLVCDTVSEIKKLELLSPITGEIVALSDTGTIAYEDTTTIPGLTCTSVTLTNSDLQAILNEVLTSAEVTQQAEYDSGTPPVASTENGSSGSLSSNTSIAQGDLEVTLGSGSGKISVIDDWKAGENHSMLFKFNAVPSAAAINVKVVMEMEIYNSSGDHTLYGKLKLRDDNDNIVASLSKSRSTLGTSTKTYTFNLPSVTNINELEDWYVQMYASQTSFEAFDTLKSNYCRIEYDTDTTTTRLTDVEIAGFNVGYGLSFFGRVDGPVVDPVFSTGYAFDEGTGWNNGGTGTQSSDTTTKTEGTAAQKLTLAAETEKTVTDSTDSELSNSNNTIANNTIASVACVEATSSGSGTFSQINWSPASTIDFTDGQDLVVLVYVDQSTGLSHEEGLEIILTDGATTNREEFWFGNDAISAGKWVALRFNPNTESDETVGSAPDMSVISTIGVWLRHNSNSGRKHAVALFRVLADGSMQKVNLSSVDLEAANESYQLSIRADDVPEINSVEVWFSDTAGTGSTRPADYKRFSFASSSLTNGSFVDADKTALDVGSPTVGATQTMGVEINRVTTSDGVRSVFDSGDEGSGEVDPVVWVDDLRLADNSAHPYQVASIGETIKHPADVLYHLLRVRADEDSGIFATDALSDLATLLGSDVRIDAELTRLGGRAASILSRLAFELGFQIHQRGDGSFRFLGLDESLDWPAPSATVTDWTSYSRLGVDSEDVATEHTLVYDFDPARDTTDEIAQFSRAVVATPDQNTVPELVNPETLTSARDRYGVRQGQTIGLRAVSDDTTAERTMGVVANERSTPGARVQIEGVPWWEAATLEPGDVIHATPPGGTSPRAIRLLETVQRRLDRRTDVLGVEVFMATLLSPEARTADATATIPGNPRGGYLIVDVTAITSTPSVVPKIQVQDDASSNWYTVLSGAAQTAVGDLILYIGPGGDDTPGDDVDTSLALHLPSSGSLRVFMDHADTDSITYSVGWLPVA